MKTSPNCSAVIRYYESCKLHAYPDPATGGLPWTIGWGATGPGIGPMTVWTQDEADVRLARDIVLREAVANNSITAPVTQGQFDAFVSILFNVGQGGAGRDGVIRLSNGQPSTLLRKINSGDAAGAALEFPKWCKANGMTMLGLRRRRATEQALFQGFDARQAIQIGASVQ